MRSSFVLILLLCFVLCVGAAAQSPPQSGPERNTPPPRSDSQPQINDEGSGTENQAEEPSASTEIPHSPNDSSSRSTLIDLTPPAGDLQSHPNSSASLNGGDGGAVNEMHPWNPHRAAKDLEVGEYYFREKNYRGAEGRYRDALIYKPNDAVATYRLAEILEKTGRPTEAREYYEAYLKVLPHGPNSEDARKALEKLQAKKTE